MISCVKSMQSAMHLLVIIRMLRRRVLNYLLLCFLEIESWKTGVSFSDPFLTHSHFEGTFLKNPFNLLFQQASAQRELLGKWKFTNICEDFCEPGQRSFSICRCLGTQSFIGKRSPWFSYAGLCFRKEKLWHTSQLQAISTDFVKWKDDSFLCLVSIFLLYWVITLWKHTSCCPIYLKLWLYNHLQ